MADPRLEFSVNALIPVQFVAEGQGFEDPDDRRHDVAEYAAATAVGVVAEIPVAGQSAAAATRREKQPYTGPDLWAMVDRMHASSAGESEWQAAADELWRVVYPQLLSR